MFTFRALILLATCLSWSSCKDSYCSICQDHTMCKYHEIGKACVDLGSGGVSEKEKKDIVNNHNLLRRTVAKGLETRGISGSFPKAANMRELVWDNELAMVAQRWSDQCTFAHDNCRNDKRWKVGQNIFMEFQYPVSTINWTHAIYSWYDEVSQYDSKEVQTYRFQPMTGHFTQMIWHDTYTIGCGRRMYNHTQLYVCNYGPTGNWIGERVYTIGEPCSECPSGTFCNDNLCAKKAESRKTNLLQEDTNEIEVDEDTKKELDKITLYIKELLKGAIKRAKERS